MFTPMVIAPIGVPLSSMIVIEMPTINMASFAVRESELSKRNMWWAAFHCSMQSKGKA